MYGRAWVGLVVLGLWACRTGAEIEETDTDADTDADSDSDSDSVAGATVAIASHADGDATYSDVTISYDITFLTLDADAIGTENVPGMGHVRVYLDGAYVASTAETSYTFTGLGGGEHTLEVRLAENDGTEIGVSDTVTVTTLVPTIAIASPADGATLDVSSTELTLSIGDFTLEDGSTNAIGRGHYHVWVDGAYFEYGTTDTFLVSRLGEGTHTIRVDLVNNDHTPLSPSVADEITVTVSDGAAYLGIDTSTFGDTAANPWNSGTVPLSLEVDNFTLAPDDIGGGNEDGHGHYHVYVDGNYVMAAGDAFTYLYNQQPGEHVIKVALANNDHTETGAADWFRIELAADRPDVVIKSPPEGELVTANFAMTMEVENYTLDDEAIGGPNEDGHGHLHIFLDDLSNYLGYTADGSFSVTDVPPGDHTLIVTLNGNDHYPLSPEVLDAVNVTVQ